jgi:hypothetical protein
MRCRHRVTGQLALIGSTVTPAAMAVGQHRLIIGGVIHVRRPETIAPLCPQKLDGRLLLEVDQLRRWVKTRPDVSEGPREGAGPTGLVEA